jgi:hypothetical protein
MSFARSRRAAVALATCLTLTLARCAPPPTPYASLDRDLAPLRAQFNADAGRTRVLMLIAPT